nr:MAG: hypothetical protein DIU68_10660 [Chloroflexota bacterium]
MANLALPTSHYNERYVVRRLLDAVARLDYPRDKLTIQVLDDSTDETSEIVAARVAALRATGLDIQHIRRANRNGFKAGALAYGLERLTSEYVAVLDADFVPPPSFLRDIIPHMVADPSIGMVQSRWGHLNANGNMLTRGQAMALDGHFVVEQVGRNRSGWLINFNGSGGVWRTAAIHDAGGWTDETLTEDLDLSYRAQLKGWKFLYLPSVVVPGELPPDLAAYKQQQARWAKGGTQCMVLLLGKIWRSPRLTFTQRVMATAHLAQYMNAVLMIVLLVLTPPVLILTRMENMPLGPLGLAGLGPPLVYLVSQHALYPNWKQRFLHFPALMAIGTGLAWNNCLAVLSGLFQKKGEFKRTPKYAINRTIDSSYRLAGDWTIVIEALFSVYALMGALIAMRLSPTLVIYLGIYCFAFGVVALWGISETVKVRRSLRVETATSR